MRTLGYYSFTIVLTCCGRSSGTLVPGNILFSHYHTQYKLHNFSSDRKPRIKFPPMISSVTKKRDDEKLRKIFFISLPPETSTNFFFLPLCGSVSGKLNYKTSHANFRESCKSKVSFELLEKEAPEPALWVNSWRANTAVWDIHTTNISAQFQHQILFVNLITSLITTTYKCRSTSKVAFPSSPLECEVENHLRSYQLLWFLGWMWASLSAMQRTVLALRLDVVCAVD